MKTKFNKEGTKSNKHSGKMSLRELIDKVSGTYKTSRIITNEEVLRSLKRYP